MQSITFALDPNAVRKGMASSAKRGARSDLEAMKIRVMQQQCAGCEVSTCSDHATLFNIAPMTRIPFAGMGTAAHPRVQRVAAAVATSARTVVAIGRAAAVAAVAAVAPAAEPQMVDQYAVGDPSAPKRGLARFVQLVYGVAISNDTHGRPGRTSTLLGPTGHYERLSFWTHIGGAAIFVAYAIVRHTLARDEGTVEGDLTTAAGWTIAAVFLTSSVYHATAPDAHFAMVTRVLDYIAIYIGITVSTTADIAVATRGFSNVPYETIADLPLATALLVAFFVWRRWMLPIDETWTEHQRKGNKKLDGCSLCLGLFSRGHCDGAHIHARQATSLLIFANFFMSAPTAFALLGSGVASVVLVLQVLGFVLVTFGMAIDRVLEFPDGLLLEQEDTCFACPSSCGGVMNSHAVWHIIAVLSAMCTVFSREFALFNY